MRTLGSMYGEGGPATIVDFKNIDEELRYLRSLVTRWRAEPQIRNLAVSIVQNSGAPMKDKKAQALAIAAWVREHIYYIHELPERFQTPAETLRLKAGDCDDTTTLIGSMIESVGIPSRLVCMVVNFVPSHIFPAAVMQKTGNLLPLDTTMTDFDVHDLKSPVEWATERGKRVTLKIV